MANDDPPQPGLSHVDADGHARMVDVGHKPVTDRRAVAHGRVVVGPDVARAIRENSLKKGDLLQVARLGGVGAAKRASDLVLLCHPLPLSHVEVEAHLDGDCVQIVASVKTAGQTGVEIEALTAVMGAALNVVDMGKALNPHITITDVRVVEKHGGKSGPGEGPSATSCLVALLIVSDSRSAGEKEDLATPLLTEAVAQFLGAEVWRSALTPDEQTPIEAQLRSWVEAPDAPHLILTSGGTGVGPRDVTPEATSAVIERFHPGLLELARARCLPGKPHAYLSRAVAGVARSTLIVNLPGSPRGAADTLRLMADVLPHALQTLRDPASPHPPA